LLSTDQVIRFQRDLPPAHYTFKVVSFSKMLKIFPGDTEPKYDSDVFEVGGYKWRLSFYPNGRKDCHGKGNISLYLVITETDSLPLGWEVNAIFRLFVLDQFRGKYLTLQDAEVRLFHAMKTDWGFSQFLSLSTFGDAFNGYLVDDSCVFGAEVFVVKYTGEGECLSILSSPIRSSSTWEIEKFSTLSEKSLTKELRVGEHQWYMWFQILHPVTTIESLKILL
ncbi:Ubiquitin carboxyl-terminal hydrolase 12, partial [Morella rubra]